MIGYNCHLGIVHYGMYVNVLEATRQDIAAGTLFYLHSTYGSEKLLFVRTFLIQNLHLPIYFHHVQDDTKENPFCSKKRFISILCTKKTRTKRIP